MTTEAGGAAEELAGDRGTVGLDEHAHRAPRRWRVFRNRGRNGTEIRDVVERRVQRATRGEDLERALHLLGQWCVGDEVAQPLRLDHPDRADAGRARKLTPRTVTE